MTSTALTKYTPMDVDDLEAQEKQIGFGSGGGQFFQFKDGRNTVRILPGLHGMQPFAQFWKHFVKASADGRAWGGACPLKMAKQPCPVCQVAAKLSRSASEADRDLAGELTPRRRIVCNLIDRSSPDQGPQLAEVGPSIYDAVKDIMKQLGEDPTHPTEGFDLIVEKSGSGLRTEYKVTPLRKNSPIHSDATQMDEWLDGAADLRTQVNVQTEAEISTRLAGTIISHHLGSRGQPPQGGQARSAGTRTRASADAADVDDGGPQRY